MLSHFAGRVHCCWKPTALSAYSSTLSRIPLVTAEGTGGVGGYDSGTAHFKS